MRIDNEKCIACGTCAAYCPTDAIVKEGKTYYIDEMLCVECNNCYRSQSCKQEALLLEKLTYPRSLRNVFSDVYSVAKETGVAGRGTEEMKTNDVTNRIKNGQAIVGIELGRPSVSTTFRDVDKMTRVLFKHRVRMESSNPLASLIDLESGKVKEELLDERAISCIIEVLTELEDLEDVLKAIIENASRLDTVFSLFVASKIDAGGKPEAQTVLERMKIPVPAGGKTNVGLGQE